MRSHGHAGTQMCGFNELGQQFDELPQNRLVIQRPFMNSLDNPTHMDSTVILCMCIENAQMILRNAR